MSVEPVKDTATQRQIAWRRSKVAEYDAMGYTQQAIADVLKVSLTTINSDIMWLRRKSAEGIRTYTEERLPHLFDKSLLGLTQILKEAWTTASNSKYERNRVLSLSLAKECIIERMNLAADARIVEHTASFVARKRKILEQLQQDEWDEAQTSDELPVPEDSNSPTTIAESEPEMEEMELLH